MSRHTLVGTGHMEVFNAKLSTIWLTLEVAIKKRDMLQLHGV